MFKYYFLGHFPGRIPKWWSISAIHGHVESMNMKICELLYSYSHTKEIRSQYFVTTQNPIAIIYIYSNILFELWEKSSSIIKSFFFKCNPDYHYWSTCISYESIYVTLIFKIQNLTNVIIRIDMYHVQLQNIQKTPFT